jgi:hypothetical protein
VRRTLLDPALPLDLYDEGTLSASNATLFGMKTQSSYCSYIEIQKNRKPLTKAAKEGAVHRVCFAKELRT